MLLGRRVSRHSTCAPAVSLSLSPRGKVAAERSAMASVSLAEPLLESDYVGLEGSESHVLKFSDSWKLLDPDAGGCGYTEVEH